jgi:hypothetical protein
MSKKDEDSYKKISNAILEASNEIGFPLMANDIMWLAQLNMAFIYSGYDIKTYFKYKVNEVNTEILKMLREMPNNKNLPNENVEEPIDPNKKKIIN